MLSILITIFFTTYVLSGILLTLGTRATAKRMDAAMNEYFERKPENKQLLEKIKPIRILNVMYLVSFIPIYNTYILIKGAQS